jgi:hypothetical protein
MMATARSLVSLFSVFVVFFIFKKIMIKKFTRTAITPVTITNTGDAAFYYSISPAISNGLSFNARNGTISGTPILFV